MTIEQCAIDFLCNLALPVRNSMRQVILSQAGIIQAELTVLNSQLAALEAQLFPVNAAFQIAKGVLNQVQSNAAFQILDASLTCTDVGNLKKFLSLNVEKRLNEVRDRLEDLKRKISIADKLQEKINELQKIKDKLDEYIDEIDRCEEYLAVGVDFIEENV